MTTATGAVVRVERLDKPRGGRSYALHLDTGETRLVPSVTTITGAALHKPALIGWAKNVALEKARAELYACFPPDIPDAKYISLSISDINAIIERARKRPDEVRDAAAGFGTQFHALIDEYLKAGAMPPMSPQHQVVFENWVTWQKQAGLLFAFTERVVWSLQHGFAGTMDAVAYTADGEKLTLCDWKTSAGIYPEMYLQLGGYALAHEEMSGDRIDHAWIVRVSKDAPQKLEDAFEAQLIDGRKLDSAKVLFLAALQLVEGVKEFDDA